MTATGFSGTTDILQTLASDDSSRSLIRKVLLERD